MTAVSEPPTTTSTARILLADDEDIFLRATAAMLRRAGYACDVVSSAEAAAAALKRGSYDLLIADLQMPGNQNMEFLSHAKADCDWLPIVVVTAYPTVQTAVNSLRLSIVDYLVKPVAEGDLLERAKNAIEKGHALRALRQAQRDMSQSVARLQSLETSLKATAEQTPSQGFSLTLDQFLSMTLSNLVHSATSLKSTMDALNGGRPGERQDLCKLIQCPRMTHYREALLHAVDVLEKTRHSFKSKELAALRSDLEALLNK